MYRGRDVLTHVGNSRGDLLGRAAAFFRELANLFGDDGESAAVLPGTRSLDRCIECEQVGLPSDPGNSLHEVADTLRRDTERAHGARGASHTLADRQQCVRRPNHGVATALRCLDQPHRVVLRFLCSHAQTIRRRQHFSSAFPADNRIRALSFDLHREILRCAREARPCRIQAVRCAGELLRGSGDLLGLALHGADQPSELLEHTVEAALQESELVGVSALRAR